MKEHRNRPPFTLSGRWQYRLRSLLVLIWAMIYVSARRLFRGARLPNWSWSIETSTYFLKIQSSAAFIMQSPADGREYEDAFTFNSPAVPQVNIEHAAAPIKGDWYLPKSKAGGVTVLYLHGGGYVYYSKAHENLIALFTLAAEARTFVPDYRLIPEHPFPAQLEDSLAAYRWLLETGVAPERLVIAGDSAGGNLTLVLLLALRDAGLPLPRLAVCLAPWTDVTNPGNSMNTNAAYDWVEKRMADRWARWLCHDADPANPLISPINANLRGLPPIYIQAGSAEILHDMICTFADTAKKQGAAVSLEIWKNMTHDFQAFGDLISESKDALQRIGEVVRENTA